MKVPSPLFGPFKLLERLLRARSNPLMHFLRGSKTWHASKCAETTMRQQRYLFHYLTHLEHLESAFCCEVQSKTTILPAFQVAALNQSGRLLHASKFVGLMPRDL